MTHKHSVAGTALAVVLSMVGCDRKGDVDQQIEDLKKAEQQSPQKAQELNQELDEAKRNVVRLEEKHALAKQGVTDDVLKERAELQKALSNDEQEVKKEVNEAQGKAREHNSDVNTAQQELQKVQAAQQVKARVNTETEVVPNQNQVQVETRQQQVPIEQKQLVERKNEQPASGTTTRSTTTGVTAEPMRSPNQ
jgi:hypothetical protein